MSGSQLGLPFNVHQLHPPVAIHQTEASVTASVTTQTFLSTSLSAPIAHTNASSVSYTFEAMQHYADPLQKENTSTKHEKARPVDDELLALCELPPGSLDVAVEPRASPFARQLNRSRVSRPQERLGRNHKGRSRFPRAVPITPASMSRGPTHNLHGLGGAFEGHNVHVAPSICASGVAHDRRERLQVKSSRRVRRLSFLLLNLPLRSPRHHLRIQSWGSRACSTTIPFLHVL